VVVAENEGMIFVLGGWARNNGILQSSRLIFAYQPGGCSFNNLGVLMMQKILIHRKCTFILKLTLLQQLIE
jgi:hypothetical protein